MIADMKKILNKSWTNIKIQLHFFTICVICICTWYLLSGMMVDVYKTYINPQEFSIKFPLPARFPIWHDKCMDSPYFYIEYFIVGCDSYLCGLTAIIFASIYIVLSLHGVALMEILHQLISYATRDNFVPSKERVKYLESCIRLQQQVYEYCHKLNCIYKIVFVPVFLITMFVNCLIIFQFSLAGSKNIDVILRSLIYISATMTEIAFCCCNCQRLTTESGRLSFTFYANNWYNESEEFKLLTRMMILRSNRDVKLTVGGFTNLLLMTLLMIMRSTISYFLLLREVNDAN